MEWVKFRLDREGSQVLMTFCEGSLDPGHKRFIFWGEKERGVCTRRPRRCWFRNHGKIFCVAVNASISRDINKGSDVSALTHPELKN
jgi:hypothetical protein